MTHPQRFTPEIARTLLQQASELLRSRADITFSFGSCERPAPIEMPPGMSSDTVDDNGFHFLVSHYPAGNGVRVIFVDRIARTDIGGRARGEKRVCVVPFDRDVPSTARKLAHELVHLLGISEHINDGRSPEPGREAEWTTITLNLMYSGLLNPAAELNPDQVAVMRSSDLAKKFGG